MCSILIVCVYRFCKVYMYFFVDFFFLYKINLLKKKQTVHHIKAGHTLFFTRVSVCKPTLPRIDQLYNVRKPVFHLPKIKHKFAEQLLDYQLVKLLNKNGSFRISSKVFTHSKKGFSSCVKNIVIETYEVQCNIVNCVSCRI